MAIFDRDQYGRHNMTITTNSNEKFLLAHPPSFSFSSQNMWSSPAHLDQDEILFL